jgi:hypothetical protein
MPDINYTRELRDEDIATLTEVVRVAELTAKAVNRPVTDVFREFLIGARERQRDIRRAAMDSVTEIKVV